MSVPQPHVYPAHREADVVLRDGSTVHVRPVRPDDRAALLQFLEGLSQESRALRFFSGFVNLAGEADRAIDVDYRNRHGLVATAGAGGRVVGHALYIKSGAGRAEVAFAVADSLQGRGLGTQLVECLAEHACENGLETFEAQVLPANHRMVEVFRESGFPVRVRSEPGLLQIEFPTSPTPEALERFEQRERIAAVAAMRTFLSPRSVAVVGASRHRGSIGGEVFHNLLEAGFAGPVYPVNPNADVVQSVRAYASMDDLPRPVDLAVIVVPGAVVIEAARACAAAGVRALVVISAGFAETGPEGAELQRQLLTVCRESGMRLIGPNCMGILNTNPEVGLNATFAPIFPPRGPVGFLSQSGALGLAVMDYARARGIGLSSFVSVGNKADISSNDLLNYWESDDDTALVLLYLESFGNPRRFARITRAMGRHKPVVAVKSGRSLAGARATSSHTGALIAASDVTVDALFRQAGVIRADSLAELFDLASLLTNQPPPAGRRVAIITNAGGPGILCADACEGGGLEVPSFPDAVRVRLAAFLPAAAAIGNPVDMVASASAEDYRRAIEVVAESGAADAIVVIFIPPLATRAQDVGAAVRDAAALLDGSLPLLAVFMSSSGPPAELQAGATGIPTYAFPEEAARALVRAVHYGEWRARPGGSVPTLEGTDPDGASAVVAAALATGPGWLPADQVPRLLGCYGMTLAEGRIAGSPGDAGRIAAELGGAVALKAVAPWLIHKTEAHVVALGLAGAAEVEAAAERMGAEVRGTGREVEGYLVQRIVPGGIEMLVGVVHDATFGPVVACGAGGTSAELMKDVAVRITPLTDADATEMVRSLATFPLLDGYRGAPKADVPALEDLLLRVSAMVDAHPEIAEMDLNPVKVLERGAVVVDARIRLEQPSPPAGLGVRPA